jgi:hypothetical protein
VVVVFLTDNSTTPTKVVLSCFGLLVGLWQLGQKCKSMEQEVENLTGEITALKVELDKKTEAVEPEKLKPY